MCVLGRILAPLFIIHVYSLMEFLSIPNTQRNHFLGMKCCFATSVALYKTHYCM